MADTIVVEEFSDTVEEGDVIRTDPAALEEYDGVDPITIYVSKGPAPSVGGGGFPAVSQFGGMLIGANG